MEWFWYLQDCLKWSNNKWQNCHFHRPFSSLTKSTYFSIISFSVSFNLYSWNGNVILLLSLLLVLVFCSNLGDPFEFQYPRDVDMICLKHKFYKYFIFFFFRDVLGFLPKYLRRSVTVALSTRQLIVQNFISNPSWF